MDETRQKERERYDMERESGEGWTREVGIVGGTLVLSSRSGFPRVVGLTCAFQEANTCAHQTRNTNTNTIRYRNTIHNTNTNNNELYKYDIYKKTKTKIMVTVYQQQSGRKC